MKNYLLLLFPLLLISCSEGQRSSSTYNTPTENKEIINDTAGWINSFREFRDAVYHRDKQKVKQLFHFPIITKDDPEIWYLAGAPDGHDNSKPFTEQDFDANYDKLFPKMFINTILKIKTEALFHKDGTNTAEIGDSGDFFNMYVSADSTTKVLTMILNFKSVISDGEYSESSIIYEFDLLPNGAIKFKRIKMAG